MDKYKVLKPFRDVYTKEFYKVDEVIELSESRANEAFENLKKFDGEYLELIPEEKEFNREDAMNRLRELGVEFKGNASNDTLKQLLEEQEGD